MVVAATVNNSSCPSPTPTFNARSLKNAKWSSQEDIQKYEEGRLLKGPKIWTPRNSSSNSNPNVKSIPFECNSLKHTKSTVLSNSSDNLLPKDSFAWKDPNLNKAIKELEQASSSQDRLNKNIFENQSIFDRKIDNSIGNWSHLPKAPNQDIVLLRRAREEKKVKKYLDENFRDGNRIIKENEKIYQVKREYESQDENRQKHKMVDLQPISYTSLDEKTVDGMPLALRSQIKEDQKADWYKHVYNSIQGRGKSKQSCGYNSEPDYEPNTRRRISESSFDSQTTNRSAPHSPPPFRKAESRYEREQRIKVGSLEGYIPGGASVTDSRYSPPPSVSSAQAKYERDRYRVQPGRLWNGALSPSKDRQTTGCSITKYSGSHSFNPLVNSKSDHNIRPHQSSSSFRIKKLNSSTSERDGYESDSILEHNKHSNNQISFRKNEQQNIRRPVIQSPVHHTESDINADIELRRRQENQMKEFYQELEQRKSAQMKQDAQNRKHHDNLLPTEKFLIPRDRYESFIGHQDVVTHSSALQRQHKILGRALFNFDAQNQREINFKKGDILYIRRRIDSNWYEGEKNAVIGIFPVSYVEILDEVSSLKSAKLSNIKYKAKGQARAMFSFTAQSPLELSLIKGDIVLLTRRIDDNWYEGQIGSRKGIFPSSYVEILSEPENRLTSESPILKSGATPGAQSISKSESNVLSLNHSLNSDQSPLSTVSKNESDYETLSSTMKRYEIKNSQVPYRVLYNYAPQNEDEIELVEGDIVYVVEKCDDGWFVGTSQRTEIFGTFPGNYVTKI